MIIDLNLFFDATDNLEILAARMRHQRNLLLAGSDWSQLPDAPVDKTAWAAYRQALRDLPATWQPGPTVSFPTPPA